jgi:hypothetical protein
MRSHEPVLAILAVAMIGACAAGTAASQETTSPAASSRSPRGSTAPGEGLQPLPAGGVPAFPGAEGGGALSKGGRGGTVHEVTRLADSGPGSLRACVEATGPRTCVFRVGGTIQLVSSLVILEPYITIAGQTAPGGGIQVVGPFSTGDASSPNNLGGLSTILVRTHDVVVRYLRIRHGAVRADLCEGSLCKWRQCRGGDRQGRRCSVGGKPDNIGLAPTTDVSGIVENVVLDHISSQWGIGKAFGAWNNSGVGKLRGVTIQWSLAAEVLKGHSTSLIVGSDNIGLESARDISNSIADLDWHHNLTMSSSVRHPLIKAKRARFVNNIVYNWGSYATQIGGGGSIDVIGNIYKPGPMTRAATHEIQVYPWTANYTVPSGEPSLYLARNVGPHNGDVDADNWGTMTWWVNDEGASESAMGAGNLDGSRYKRLKPLSPVGMPITMTTAGKDL